jgi:hypothetical protein
MRLRQLLLVCAVAVPYVSTPLSAQSRSITTPREAFGFNLGDDYRLANYTQLEAYWKTLARQSDRMKLVDIGLTAEGRHHYMAVITSAANQKRLDHYRSISKRLATAEGLTDEQARALAKEGKAVIFMDGGLHSTETVGHQALIELAYQMVSRDDEETRRLLDDDILLLCLANPDGMELVSNWYMREPDSSKRTLNIPRLYQKYVGHDNARDLFMSNQVETANITKVLFTDWLPQITHTHHQTGPAGAVVFMPPFRDPFNYGFDPLVITQLDLVGAAMHSRLIAKGMPGSVTKAAANYSTWFNGAMRTVSYFHNMVGLLTEIIGSPTPMEVPLVLERQLASGNGPMPVAPQQWHFRRSIDYDMEYSRAVMDVASRYRETFLYNIYQMGKNAIARGNSDSWTVTPKRIAAAESAAAKLPALRSAGGGGDGGARGAVIVPSQIYASVLHDPAMRDARGYVLSASQPDFGTATKFVNVLIKNGIAVHRATAPFQVAGKSYPASSYVVKTAQASRAFVVDMFEPQDHPNDFKYPGGPPNPPYDVTGWTPAYSMGVQFDRFQDGFDGPFARVTGVQPMPSATLSGVSSPAGYVVSHRINNSFIVANRLLKANADVFMLKEPTRVNGEDLGAGAIWVRATPAVKAVLERGARELGVPGYGVSTTPGSTATRLRQARIGVYDQYGGNIPSGWTKWIFEQFEYPYQIVYPQTLDAGNLKASFDVLVFPDGSARLADGRARAGGNQPAPESIPAEFRGWLGSVTAERTIPQLKRFAEDGGTIIALGSSTSMGELLGVPVKNYLVEKDASGNERPLGQDKFYIPGSLLRMSVKNSAPIAYGMPDKVDVVFNNSPVFRLAPDAAARGVTAVASFDAPDLVSSGWAWGRDYVRGGAAIVDAPLGKGKVVLFGPEVAFRGQTHSTFKLLFNGLYDYGSADQVLP